MTISEIIWVFVKFGIFFAIMLGFDLYLRNGGLE